MVLGKRWLFLIGNGFGPKRRAENPLLYNTIMLLDTFTTLFYYFYPAYVSVCL